MEDAIREIKDNPKEVLTVIGAICDGTEGLLATQGHSPNSYYGYGHCNIFAEILVEIFGDYAEPFNSTGHYITKIGDTFYDVNGKFTNPNEISKFGPQYKELLLEPKIIGVGNYSPGFDDEVISKGVEFGLAYVKEYQEKNMGKSI